MLKRELLHDYQNRGVRFIKDNHGCALFLDMGAGKTVTSLTAMADMYDDFETDKFLVIAPLRVAETVWKQESANWEHTSHLNFAICTGAVKDRINALNKDATVTVINRENIPWLVKYYGKKWPFKMIVIDESSSFKSPSSKRFRGLKSVMKFVDRCVLLTGTPASNGYIDLWSQFYLLDMGHRLGYTVGAYRRSYFTVDHFGYTYTIKDGAMQQIEGKINDITMSLDPEEYANLPDNIYSVMSNKLSGSLLKEYKKFEKDALLAVGDSELTAVSAAVLTNKLLQFSGGAVYGEPEPDTNKKPVYHFHDLKFDTLNEILEANPEENLLVAYNYKHELERLMKRYPDAVMMDKKGEAVEAWNRGEIKMMLVHPKSAGHGLNLQHGGNILVWFSFTWSLEEYQQLNKRLHRQGQKNTVRTFHIAVGEVEEKLMRSVTQKGITQEGLLKALR